MESGTLHQIQVRKNKMKHNLCYVGLVVLIILLFIPPMFRLFIKDKDSGKEKKDPVYIALNCNKSDESINATFEDGIPQNIMYKVKGNVSKNNPDEVSTTETNMVDSNSLNQNSTSNTKTPFNDDATVYDILTKFGEFEYLENEGNSVIRIPYSIITAVEGYDLVFGTINGQENFYTSRGFSCAQVAF